LSPGFYSSFQTFLFQHTPLLRFDIFFFFKQAVGITLSPLVRARIPYAYISVPPPLRPKGVPFPHRRLFSRLTMMFFTLSSPRRITLKPSPVFFHVPRTSSPSTRASALVLNFFFSLSFLLGRQKIHLVVPTIAVSPPHCKRSQNPLQQPNRLKGFFPRPCPFLPSSMIEFLVRSNWSLPPESLAISLPPSIPILLSHQSPFVPSRSSLLPASSQF